MDEIKLTDEMQEAVDKIEYTEECLFITGKAGTGKTTLLKYIVDHTRKRYVVAASTGVAAMNAGGVTLHRLFTIPLEVQDPTGRLKGNLYKDKMGLYKELELLIIDEVSMVRPDTLDYIDRKLRLARMVDRPFGGVQVVCFGDLFQLPPVIKSTERDVLSTFYRGSWFYYARVWRECGFRTIELTQVFRQQDQKFIDMLNRIRVYKFYQIDEKAINRSYDCKAFDEDTESIVLTTLRKDAETINLERLGEPTHTYTAVLKDGFNAKSMTCPDILQLRVGARVMTIANDKEDRYINGSMGYVVECGDNYVIVDLDEGGTVKIEPFTWTEKEYVTDPKTKEISSVDKGSCTQMPLRLAWAITIHKSQGLTFDKVKLKIPFAFSPGQLYVALSRCRSLEGIKTRNYIKASMIRKDPDLEAFRAAVKEKQGWFDKDTYMSMRLR